MALILCPECGKKFSDKASACPECGCPMEYILGELKKNETVKTTSTGEKYNILGKEFVLDKSLYSYITLKIVLNSLRGNMRDEASVFYRSMKSVDELIDQLPEQVSEIMDKLLDSAVNTLVQMGVYDIDKPAFFQKYYVSSFDAQPIMASLVERYLGILDYENGLKQYQEYIKASHKKWIGGGFGVIGAIKGSITAELMNIGNSFLHALPDHTRRVNNEYAVQKKKDDMLHDPETYKVILSALECLFDGIFNSMMQELVLHHVFIDYNFNSDKAFSLLNNYSHNVASLKDSAKIEILREAFFADPSMYPVYHAILCTDFDKSGDVRRIAEKLGYYEIFLKEIKEYQNEEQRKLIDEHEDEIEWIKAHLQKVSNNSELFSVLDKCLGLTASIGINLNTDIYNAVVSRITNNFSSGDIGAIRQYIKVHQTEIGEKLTLDIMELLDSKFDRKKAESSLAKLFDGFYLYQMYFMTAMVSPLDFEKILYAAMEENDLQAQEAVYDFLIGDYWANDNAEKNVSYSNNIEAFLGSFETLDLKKPFVKFLIGQGLMFEGNGSEAKKYFLQCEKANYPLIYLHYADKEASAYSENYEKILKRYDFLKKAFKNGSIKGGMMMLETIDSAMKQIPSYMESFKALRKQTITELGFDVSDNPKEKADEYYSQYQALFMEKKKRNADVNYAIKFCHGKRIRYFERLDEFYKLYNDDKVPSDLSIDSGLNQKLCNYIEWVLEQLFARYPFVEDMRSSKQIRRVIKYNNTNNFVYFSENVGVLENGEYPVIVCNYENIKVVFTNEKIHLYDSSNSGNNEEIPFPENGYELYKAITEKGLLSSKGNNQEKLKQFLSEIPAYLYSLDEELEIDDSMASYNGLIREEVQKSNQENTKKGVSSIFKMLRPDNAKNDKDKLASAKYCAFCGKQIERTVKFCNFCGEAVRE